MFDLEREKAKFKRKGWSYRRAAPVLEVTYQYLSDVLNGKHTSRRLVKKIGELPRCANGARRKAAGRQKQEGR